LFDNIKLDIFFPEAKTTVCVHARRGKCFKQKPLISAIHYEFNSGNANMCSILDSLKCAHRLKGYT